MSDEYKMSEPNTNHNTIFNKIGVLEQQILELKELIEMGVDHIRWLKYRVDQHSPDIEEWLKRGKEAFSK